MSEADQVVESICQSYMKTVNASDAVAYSKLFTTDVIWMQPGTPIRHGRDEIVADFGGALETYKVDIDMTPGDTIQIAEDWIYGISHVDGVLTEKADSSKSAFKFTVAQLLQRQASGEWLIRRQMWNNKPD
ncbi:MAG: SgcJ/EcaC family oxidoreductase [Hyphomicrobium sp.]